MAELKVDHLSAPAIASICLSPPALICRPRLLLVDELSLGLAPVRFPIVLEDNQCHI